MQYPSLLPRHIGGPNTCLPFFVESLLGWSLCVSCLAVSGYHYGKSVVLASASGWRRHLCRSVRDAVRRTLGRRMGGILFDRSCVEQPSGESRTCSRSDDVAQWIPLTTHSRAELDGRSPWQRYLALVRVFEKRHPEVLAPLMTAEPTERGMGRKLSNLDDILSLKHEADAALVRVLRTDDICRRLASLAMRPYDAAKFDAPTSPNNGGGSKPIHTTTLLRQLPHNQLLQRMNKLWNYLLRLPSLGEAKAYRRLPASDVTPISDARAYCRSNHATYPYRISLILPAYRERGSHLHSKLTKALEMAACPVEVEVVVVDAGGCCGLDRLLPLAGQTDCGDQDGGETKERCWGRVAIYSFSSGGGRGPCLNFGASVGTGRILTFCHSDTTLPRGWDDRIMNTLEHDGMSDEDLSKLGMARASSCSFSFGIDTSPEGLSMTFESSRKSYYPPGIRAVETTANLRTQLYSLPYGDQVLSLHASVFHFLGGFPDQCLMEDYELVALLRRRAALFVPPSDMLTGNTLRERLAIIPGSPALCSPRRWQKFGVLYVTYMNSKFVNLYAGGMGPDDLFRLYYGRDPPERNANDSPWEVELERILKSR